MCESGSEGSFSKRPPEELGIYLTERLVANLSIGALSANAKQSARFSAIYRCDLPLRQANPHQKAEKRLHKSIMDGLRFSIKEMYNEPTIFMPALALTRSSAPQSNNREQYKNHG
jgi:hypothetical protein